MNYNLYKGEVSTEDNILQNINRSDFDSTTNSLTSTVILKDTKSIKELVAGCWSMVEKDDVVGLESILRGAPIDLIINE